jgi:hypothetical protein
MNTLDCSGKYLFLFSGGYPNAQRLFDKLLLTSISSIRFEGLKRNVDIDIPKQQGQDYPRQKPT